jgi:hypothetical protein
VLTGQVKTAQGHCIMRAAVLSGVKRGAGQESEEKRGKPASRRRAMNIGSYTVALESARAQNMR